MKLTLNRVEYTKTSTIGELYIDGVFECYTLEDAVRIQKVDKVTAIPAGTYRVVITVSPRFTREATAKAGEYTEVRMPLLENVPGYAGIRIHWGNYSKDTEGCILVGRTKAKDFIGGSRPAYKALFEKLDKELSNSGSISIEITDGGVSPFSEDLQEPTTSYLTGSDLEVAASALRLREQPGSMGRIITELPRGQMLRVTGTPSVAGWVHVSTSVSGKDLFGFVSTKYIRLVASQSLAPEFVAATSKLVSREPRFFDLGARSVNKRVVDTFYFRIG